MRPHAAGPWGACALPAWALDAEPIYPTPGPGSWNIKTVARVRREPQARSGSQSPRRDRGDPGPRALPKPPLGAAGEAHRGPAAEARHPQVVAPAGPALERDPLSVRRPGRHAARAPGAGKRRPAAAVRPHQLDRRGIAALGDERDALPVRRPRA